MELLEHYYNDTENDGYCITDEGKKNLLNELDTVCQKFNLNQDQKTLYDNYRSIIVKAKSLSYLQQVFANNVTKSVLMIALTEIDRDFISFYKIVALSLELKADELIQHLRDEKYK